MATDTIVLELPAEPVAALAQFTSDEETRFYLKGVHFQPAPAVLGFAQPAVIGAATDGHVLGMWLFLETAWPSEFPATGGIILPIGKGSPLVTALGKRSSRSMDQKLFVLDTGKKHGDQTLWRLIAGHGPTFDMSSGMIEAPAIDGSFPDYTRVLPKSGSPVETGAGAEPGIPSFARGTLDCFLRAAKALAPGAKATIPALKLHYTGTSRREPVPVLFPTKPEFYGVIMPIRTETPGTVDVFEPDWVKALRTGIAPRKGKAKPDADAA